MPLSEKSRLILQAIAKGQTYEQILVQDLAWTYHDIFKAAAEALENPPDSAPKKAYSVEAMRQKHALAYEKWDATQDEKLRQLVAQGESVNEIARIMQRQPSAIRSRLSKFNLKAQA
ncbi:MAG TPA: hypothetical protein VGH19_03110 [Verrucomicrobiae bacterium]